MLEYSGAIKLLERSEKMACSDLPCPPRPPPSARDDHWRTLTRRWEHLGEEFTLMRIRQLPLEESLKAWGRLRAAGVMTPVPRHVPITPQWLVRLVSPEY